MHVRRLNPGKTLPEKACSFDACFARDYSSCYRKDICKYDYGAGCPSYDYCWPYDWSSGFGGGGGGGAD